VRFAVQIARWQNRIAEKLGKASHRSGHKVGANKKTLPK
jgi:hypothetical protein